MIYSLRKKFIFICTVSFLSVFAVMIAAIFISDTLRTNKILDSVSSVIYYEGEDTSGHQRNQEDSSKHRPDFMSEETRFFSDFFTVTVCDDGYAEADVSSSFEITENQAVLMAENTLSEGRTHGWYDNFRYSMFREPDSVTIVFVSGKSLKSILGDSIISTVKVFGIGSLAVMFLIVVISKFAVKPAAESYEKQKQFITNANHELKTPLTLILTNVDIAESELGQNEWLDDIRIEGEHMNKLVNQLVTLTRMDESGASSDYADNDISKITEEVVYEFNDLAQMYGRTITSLIMPGIRARVNSDEIRQLIAILIDNAVKYCDEKGTIHVSVTQNKHVHIHVYNPYQDVDCIQLDRLFDRFYRADNARTSGSGFGIGLSIAQSVVKHHRGSIKAVKSAPGEICFKVKF